MKDYYFFVYFCLLFEFFLYILEECYMEPKLTQMSK